MIKDRVIQCFENIGLFIDDSSENQLVDIIEDSIMFISLIVELEEEFKIEIPDEYLVLGGFQEINEICQLINSIDEEQID